MEMLKGIVIGFVMAYAPIIITVVYYRRVFFTINHAPYPIAPTKRSGKHIPKIRDDDRAWQKEAGVIKAGGAE